MTPGKTLISVWRQALTEGKATIELERKSYPVTISRAKNLRMVEFAYGTYRIIGIEQNPKTSSRWALMARQGKRVMQFRCQGRYVANVCEGELLRYPSWRALDLPE
jgi:hypothetical protein